MDDHIYRRGRHVGVLSEGVDVNGSLGSEMSGVLMEWGQLLSIIGP